VLKGPAGAGQDADRWTCLVTGARSRVGLGAPRGFPQQCRMGTERRGMSRVPVGGLII